MKVYPTEQKTTIMKKLIARPGLLLTLALTAFVFAGTGCKKKKDTVETPTPKGEVLVAEYCTGAQYNSDETAFRSSATGESMSRETAKKIARSNAEDRLARSIEATIKAVTDNYVNSTKFNNKEEVTETFNNLARTIVDQELRGAVIICEQLTRNTENNNYISYLAVELSAEGLVKAYNERLSQDERIKAEYNYEKFKETFEEEMRKLSEGN
jgi:hypothetical protein